MQYLQLKFTGVDTQTWPMWPMESVTTSPIHNDADLMEAIVVVLRREEMLPKAFVLTATASTMRTFVHLRTKLAMECATRRIIFSSAHLMEATVLTLKMEALVL